MNEEDRKKFTLMMYCFRSNSPVCEGYLIRKFSEELLNEAIEHKLIRKCGKNNFGEQLYEITNEGKNFW